MAVPVDRHGAIVSEQDLTDRIVAMPGAQLGRAEPSDGGLELLAHFVELDDVPQAHCCRPVLQRKGRARGREVLPDELQHQQLVKVGVKQGAHNGIEFPVVVVRTAGNVNDHEDYFTARRATR